MTDKDLLERRLPRYFEDIPATVYDRVKEMVDEFTSKFGEMTREDIIYVCSMVSMELARRKGLVQ